MQQFIEYVPVLGFLAAYLLLKDIFLATAILLGFYVVVFVALIITNKEITKSFKLTFWLVMIFGGMTLLFQNEQFTQWKPTIFCWACASFLILYRIKNKNIHALESLFEGKVNLSSSAWGFLTYYSSFFLLIEGSVNLWVAYQFSLDEWVTFKVIGLPILSFLMIFSAFGYLIYTKQIGEQDFKDSSKNNNPKVPKENTNA